MINYLININNYKDENIGKKAYNLFKMKEEGINIPNLITISPRFLEDYLNSYKEEINKKIEKLNIDKVDIDNSKSIKEFSLFMMKLIDNISFKDIDQLKIFKSLNLDISNTFSVRSSTTVEDSKDASFAGQFDTFLNVSTDRVFVAVKDCLKSLYGENVIKYALEKEVDIRALKIAVIIQEMIPSEKSGVLFTANPKGLLNEMVLVVGNGTGNLIVEDKVETTTYYYNVTDNSSYYEMQQGATNLTLDSFNKLIDIGKKLQRIFVPYIDIEFAIYNDEIFILQCRPITTLKIKNTLIFDNSNIVESYPNITLPLTATFVKDAYYGVFYGVSKRCLSNQKLLKTYNYILKNMVEEINGRVYYNINNWYTLIKFLPLSHKIIPVWQEMLGVSDKSYSEEKITISTYQKVKTYLSFIREFILTPMKMRKLENNFQEIYSDFKVSYENNLDEKELKNLYEKISDGLLKVWDITLVNDLYAFIYVGLTKALLKAFKVKDYESVTNNYISGISNIESMKPIKGLLDLSRFTVSMGIVNGLKTIKSEESLVEFLQGEASEFSKSFYSYIDEFGDRTLEELKLETVTFRQNPLTLVEKILQYATDEEKLNTVYETFSNEKEENINLSFLSELSYFKRWLVAFTSKRAMVGIKNREASRLNRTRIYGMVRSIFNSLGEKFFEDNKLESPRDIFYLELQEVFSFIENKNLNIENKNLYLKDLIKRRKNKYEIYKRLHMNSRLVFANEYFHKSHMNINSEDTYDGIDEIIGIPCSNGIVSGEVIVVNDPKEINDFKDKILVTQITDPGWVFLITLSKGIVAEKGSLLSHTAIISRELKIPSIVGVKNITKLLKTGDFITMNGNTGEIKIEKRSDLNV